MEMVDRISKLPEPIMQHILSFLPIKQVVKTQVLSKTWNHVWTTFPILEFNRAFLMEILGDHRVEDPKRAREWHDILRKREGLLNFVEQTLLIRYRQMLSLKKFTLYMPYCDSNLVPLIDRWIGYAIECNVKELDIDIRMMDQKRYNLLEIVFDHLGAQLPKVRYSSLKRLFLSGVYVDDHSVQNLPNSCPGIEDLSFSMCGGLKRLQVSGFLQLKKVNVQECYGLERVDIEAPNLQYFKYHYDYMHLDGEINITSCKNLKTLILYGACMTEKSFHDHIYGFPLLENLELRSCDVLEHIKISSCCLKKLILYQCKELVKAKIDAPYLCELILYQCKKLVEAKIDAPYLCSFKYSGYSMVPLSMNALALSRAELSIHPEVLDTFWYVKLVEFLGQLNCVKELILHCELEDIVIPKELRQSLIPPPLSANHLTLQIQKPFHHAIVESVDGVLWMFSHLDSLSMKSLRYNISFKFQLVYEKQLDREENLRWQHCLKEAKIVYEKQYEKRLGRYWEEELYWQQSLKEAEIEGAEAVWHLKKFFFENAKNLEKVDVIA